MTESPSPSPQEFSPQKLDQFPHVKAVMETLHQMLDCPCRGLDEGLEIQLKAFLELEGVFFGRLYGTTPVPTYRVYCQCEKDASQAGIAPCGCVLIFARSETDKALLISCPSHGRK